MAQRILLQRVARTINPSISSKLLATTSKQSTSQIPSIFSYSTQQRFLSFQPTKPLFEEAKEGAAPEAEKSTEDEVPAFQNPLHHDDPNKDKIMVDEFPEGEAPVVPLPPLDNEDGKVTAPPHLHELAEEIVTMSMLEMKELVDRVADHFGIEEGEDDFIGGGDGGAAAVEEEKEEKTAFDLKLTGFDAKSKIKVIKEIRAMTGLGLKEAKEMVEGAPKTIKKEIKMEEAEELKAKLEGVGATCEIE
ncbi:large subunit ribosomal protein L7/L12 [Chaetoceros tenuissimus]|uniref:Large subunit ribosomal protein L7/L12 n=1 Tax=Chaetoceros tenuissimus TaxID=426638 RepID=A0AAD3D9J2_9STRA|nr:large subunit ribosomal protein L7/L12 [Chaetoceros tenuissimus]